MRLFQGILSFFVHMRAAETYDTAGDWSQKERDNSSFAASNSVEFFRLEETEEIPPRQWHAPEWSISTLTHTHTERETNRQLKPLRNTGPEETRCKNNCGYANEGVNFQSSSRENRIFCSWQLLLCYCSKTLTHPCHVHIVLLLCRVEARTAKSCPISVGASRYNAFLCGPTMLREFVYAHRGFLWLVAYNHCMFNVKKQVQHGCGFGGEKVL
jgi:hypothetical protein